MTRWQQVQFLSPSLLNNSGLRRCWWQACREEHIDPRKPTRLPLLFALDARLGIAGGFTYIADCDAWRRRHGGDGGGCGGDGG